MDGLEPHHVKALEPVCHFSVEEGEETARWLEVDARLPGKLHDEQIFSSKVMPDWNICESE
jgi:hypothetical protein